MHVAPGATDTFDPSTGEVQEGDLAPAPDNTDTDVSISVNHRVHRVLLKTTLRDLTAASGIAIYEIRTGTRQYAVMQRLGKKDPALAFPAFDFSRANGKPVRCAGVERNVDRAADVATVNIPRHCLGLPGWVRVGAGVAKIEATETSLGFLADDALTDASVLDELVVSPRVGRD